MKKNNLFLSLIFAFLICFGFSAPTTTQTAFADGETIQITFDASGGVCETEIATVNAEGKLDSLPNATRDGFILAGWSTASGLVDLNTTYSENTTLYASWERKISDYLISFESEKFIVTGKTTTSTINYTVSDNKTSLSDAINDIYDDLTTTSNLVTINFNNVDATENINFSLQNLKLTGELNLSKFSISYTSPENLSNLTLDNLKINSSSSQKQIEILGDKSVKITLENCAFNSTSSQNTYAIYFNNSAHSIVASGEISHTTSFLYNHKNGISSTFKSFSLTNQTNKKLAITIPFNADGNLILTTNNGLASEFDFIPLQNNYTCSPNLLLGDSVYAKVEFNLNFDANGGTLSAEKAKISSRFNSSKTEFVSGDDLTKNHSTLNGFAGKITLDSETVSNLGLSSSIWYFGKTELENFISNGSNLAQISTYFSTTVPSSNGFLHYSFSEDASDLDFQAVNLMLSLGQVPEFSAIWSETEFHISFNTNGGSSINDIIGLFGSSVTLPEPTKPGHDFVDWFIDENLETPATITTMPDTNPTVFAKWQVHSHTLTINQNNGTAQINKSVDFGTELALINEFNPEIISKTGYSFVNWFTDEALTEALTLETMPDENLTIYAKWQINSYTIKLFLNHRSDTSLFKEITTEFNNDISEFISQKPEFEGYTFTGWFTDEFGEFPYTLPNTMPAENLTLYAFWIPTEYRITFYYLTSVITTKHDMHFGDTITIPASPTISELVFENWYLDRNFTQVFNLTTMPSRNLNVYAKMIEKETISLDESTQTYTLSSNNGFSLSSKLSNFKIEYLVDGVWTITAPTKRGTYDVRITRNEDSVYKSVNKVIKGGLVVTADNIDISIINLVLYCFSGIELICAIILLFLRKQRKTYLTYAVILPFGVISNSQFINFIIALTLAVFGFVLVTIQLTKLRKLNNEIANISDENKTYKPVDVSENKSISRKVDIMLEEKGFVSATKKDDYDDNRENENNLDKNTSDDSDKTFNDN